MGDAPGDGLAVAVTLPLADKAGVAWGEGDDEVAAGAGCAGSG